MPNSEQLFILIAPKELKDDIVDILISLDALTGFNLKAINGYSKEHSSFNITEQVEGYRALVQFEVLLKVVDKATLMNALKPICHPAKLKYWFLPVIESGHL